MGYRSYKSGKTSFESYIEKVLKVGRFDSKTWIQDVRRNRIILNKKTIKEDCKKEIMKFKNWDEEVVKF